MGYLFGGPGFFEIVLALLAAAVAAALAFAALTKYRSRRKHDPKIFILCGTIPPLLPHFWYFFTNFLWSSWEGVLLFLVLGAAIWVASFLFLTGLYRLVLACPKRQQREFFMLTVAVLVIAIPIHIFLGKPAYTPCCKPEGTGGPNCVTCPARP